MIKIITAIALLCQVSTADRSYNLEDVQKAQNKCQVEYIKCVHEQMGEENHEDEVSFMLYKCMKKRY